MDSILCVLILPTSVILKKINYFTPTSPKVKNFLWVSIKLNGINQREMYTNVYLRFCSTLTI